MNGQTRKVVDKFAYLGSTLTRAVHIDDEVTARIAKSNGAFGRHANVWERNGNRLDTKLKVYTLLYACETWTVYQRHAKILNHFHKLFGKAVINQVAWQDPRHRGPEESRYAKHAYCLKASTAKVDWPCYKNAWLMSDFLRKSSMVNYKRESALKVARRNGTETPSKFDIPIGSWEQTAQDRSKWRGLINKGAALNGKRESVKLKESAENAKPIPMGHQLIQWHWLALFATDS